MARLKCWAYKEDRSLYVDDEIPYEAIRTLTPEQRGRLWTAIDVEGKLVISAGYRFVNRLAYYMSVKPWKDPSEEYQYCRESR